MCCVDGLRGCVACMRDACMRDACMRGTCMRGACMRGACMRGACMRELCHVNYACFACPASMLPCGFHLKFLHFSFVPACVLSLIYAWVVLADIPCTLSCTLVCFQL
jgi:hypothetical protein